MKSTLWLLICCKKLISDSQDKQSMKKIQWNRQAYGINGGWGTHVSKQNRILAFTGPDPRGGPSVAPVAEYRKHELALLSIQFLGNNNFNQNNKKSEYK